RRHDRVVERLAVRACRIGPGGRNGSGANSLGTKDHVGLTLEVLALSVALVRVAFLANGFEVARGPAAELDVVCLIELAVDLRVDGNLASVAGQARDAPAPGPGFAAIAA